MLKRTFRPHQYGIFTYAMKEQHPAVFVAPRLGKNLPTIRRVQLYSPRKAKRLKVLIITPNSALDSWVKELKNESEPNVYVLEGEKVAREKLISDIGIGIFRYGTNRDWFIVNTKGVIHNPGLAMIPWDCVILDESQDAKNIGADFTRFMLRNFREVPHRWILSGTPEPENQLELWTQLAFLDGHAFGYRTFWDFRLKLFTPSHFKDVWTPKPGTQKIIKDYMAKRCYLLQKEDAGIIINKKDHVVTIGMPSNIRSMYEQCERDFELTGDETLWATTKHIWLRKLCGGLDTNNEMIWEGKYTALRNILNEHDEKIIVWFNYNHELDKVMELLDRDGIGCINITGETPRTNRETKLSMWRHGAANVLLIQQAIAQTGMDLSAAKTCIYYSRNPGSLSNLQTVERFVNLSTIDRELTCYSIVVKNTVDEDLHYCISEKEWRSKKDLSRALEERIKLRLQSSGGKKR